MGRESGGSSDWRISEEHENLADSLVDLSGRDMRNVLVEAFDRRVGDLTPHDLIARRAEVPATRPCDVSQADIIRFEGSALPHLPSGTDLIALSPVAALGATATLTGLSHKTVLSTIRGTEVVADAVIPLTLEVAARRSRLGDRWSGATVGSFHRELRMQRFSSPKFTSHFHALSLVSAAPASDYEGFLHETVATHVNTYLRAFEASLELGYVVRRLDVRVSNLRVLELLLRARRRDRHSLPRRSAAREVRMFSLLDVDLPGEVDLAGLRELAASSGPDLDRIRKPLGFLDRLFGSLLENIEPRSIPVTVAADLERAAGLGYYQDVCVKISALTDAGESFDLVDIGSNDWMAALTGARHERLVTGGMGTETFLKFFGPGQPAPDARP